MTELTTASPSELVAGARSDTLALAVANLSLDGNTMLSILYHCRGFIFQSDKCSERRISGQVSQMERIRKSFLLECDFDG